MSISDEAVEAAAKYLSERFFWNGALVNEVAREVLEAAAPHMLAEARAAACTSREQARHLEAVASIAVQLGASMQGADRDLSGELYAAMGLT